MTQPQNLTRYRQQLQTHYDQAANRLAKHSHKLPAPVADFVRQSPCLALAIAAALALFLLFRLVPFNWLMVAFFLSIGIADLVTLLWLIVTQIRDGRLPGKTLAIAVLIFFFSPLPFIPQFYIISDGRKQKGVRRGTALVTDRQLTRLLTRQQAETEQPIYPQLDIAGVPIPNSLETLGFFFVGSPGSGKTQAIKRMLSTLRARPDFRVIVLDRNGELLESFYDRHTDLIFNPSDARSVGWSHRSEQMAVETIAASLVPDDSKDRFFSEAARTLLADLYDRCDDNAQLWQVLSTYSIESLKGFLAGTVSARYFESEKTGASVLSTLVNSMRFYRHLPDPADFSFSQWGRENDPRWLFLPIFEDTAERYKALYSMAFELMLTGLLSNESRQMKTALVIDELGALNHLRSLARLLSESRKFGGTAILGTQTEAQIDKVYGQNDRRILLQGTATKLILNCRDAMTAEQMASLIGRQERLDYVRNRQTGPPFPLWKGGSVSEQIRETYAVMPTELQNLPSLEGYLTIANGTPPAKVRVTPQSYPVRAERHVLEGDRCEPNRQNNSTE
ncbi:MAG: type IV secretion system DNA-binding domain-containing protein [Cyanobacteria bacterium P01_A01_bin.17]